MTSFFDIINVYAPNAVSDRVGFFQDLVNFISGVNTIIVGDFNTVFCGVDRSTGNLEYDRARQYLLNVMTTFNLRDVWRDRNPDRKVFTWRRLVNRCLRQSRIDYFLISAQLLSSCKYVYVNKNSFSDHSIVNICFNLSNVDMGPGLYCFNKLLLSDTDYVNKISNLIETEKKCILFDTDICTWWDNLKYKIKKVSQIAGERRKRQQLKI